MNLTIEEMREIVAGAPNGATHHKFVGEGKLDLYFDAKNQIEFCDFQGWCLPRFHHTEEMIAAMNSINDIRSAIADHDRTDDVSDIRNHIAPTTIVTDLHVNEALKLNGLG